MDVEELKQKNKHNWKLKIGILGISLFLQVAGSNLAAIPESVNYIRSGIIYDPFVYYYVIHSF